MGLGAGAALHRLQILLIVFPAFLSIGYGLGVLGGLTAQPEFYKQFPATRTQGLKSGPTKSHNSLIQGTVVGLFSLGNMFGALSCIYIGDKVGRRWSIFMGAIIGLIGTVIITCSFSLAQIIVGRFIFGWGCGMLTASVPTYQSECSDSKSRGVHVVFDGVFLALGICIAAWIDLGFYFVHNSSVSWRLPCAIPILMFITIAASIFLFPESPRWLAYMDRIAEAEVSLRILGKDSVEGHEATRVLIAQMQAAALVGKQGSYLDLFKMGPTMGGWRAGLAIMTQFFQQMSGSTLISYYVTTLFINVIGLETVTARILAASVLTLKTLCSCIAFVTIERWGRRNLMMLSGGGMGVCMCVIAICVAHIESPGASYVAAAFLFIFNMFYPVGLLGVNFLYCTEVSPLHLRGPITAISTATQYLFQFVIGLATPIAIEKIGYRYFIVFAVVGLIMVPTMYIFFPETTGRTLEQMDEVFAESKTIFDPPRVAKRMPVKPLIVDDATSLESNEKNASSAQNHEHIFILV
ncbi:protein of unknown function [Taphrina deformans PYCC 5710]|uniref:Major facilitator superfamily (MFS) profile domain-containing protein n=1 Tax=Taphrina deformans (strain PYCC 5710 / ATCC 11124 / CBS 356.35 / IMI 108563 / JCM 9778 / NBRC 8474) TaxID=1097556 RepID=R4XEK1_TAPDE|nr:protein of unknown function [Taphrina deformans PYCC 5710]|eukprot:CCG84196.1 protein of unknown function [Taphrina deformans PYCC 5710]